MKSVAAMAVLVLSLTLAFAEEWDETKTLSPELQRHVKQFDVLTPIDFRLLVQPGRDTEATDYYHRIGQVLDFNFSSSTLDGLLSHLGYSEEVSAGSKIFKGLTAKDIERIGSFSLMPRDQAEFDALASQVEDGVAFRRILTLSDF